MSGPTIVNELEAGTLCCSQAQTSSAWGLPHRLELNVSVWLVLGEGLRLRLTLGSEFLELLDFILLSLAVPFISMPTSVPLLLDSVLGNPGLLFDEDLNPIIASHTWLLFFVGSGGVVVGSEGEGH